MFKKIKIFFSLILLLLLILGALAYYDVKGGAEVRIFEKLGINFKLPLKIKSFLKETIFYLPNLQNENKLQAARIEELKNLRKHAVALWYLAGDAGFQKISAYFLKKENIKTKYNDYQIKLFSLPFHNHGKMDAAILYTKLLKPVAYLEQTKDNIFLASGNGIFFYFEKERVKNLVANQNLLLKYNDLELKTIKTNIRDLINNKKFNYEGYPGIRDLMILDDKIYVSYNNTPTLECYNTTIMVSELNLTNLNFSEFFTYDECVSKENKKFQSNGAPATWSGGGKMFPFKNNKILYTIGEYNDRTRAQDKQSMFGKIFSIDLQKKSHQLISMGHRNPQGLFYSEKNDVIISTEHGPKGGDEININQNPTSGNEKVKNFGWPISSYGVHYDGIDRKEAPLYKSHKDHGFIEPIKYFVPSIAITEIIKIPKTFNSNFLNDFFVGSMGSFVGEGDLSIHHIRFDQDFNKIEFEDVIPLRQRIRDLIFLEKQDTVVLILENTPAIAFLKNSKNK
jgi:hypothetical protein